MDGYDSKSYGKYLRKMRMLSKKTLGDIARELCVTASLVSSIERGKKPPFNDEENKIISELLGVKIEDLNELALRSMHSMITEEIGITEIPKNKKKDRLEFLECILTSLLGDAWREFTIQDAETFRLKQEGEELRVLTRLSEIANKAFDGKSRIELNIFGDGTMECQQIHVEEVDNKYGWQKTKIKNNFPYAIYRITDGGMNELLNDLEMLPWLDCSRQTDDGARQQIYELEAILKNITEIIDRYISQYRISAMSPDSIKKLIEDITNELNKLE